jgi:hypothetical protein
MKKIFIEREFDILGAYYCEILFKISNFVKDCPVHYYENGVEIPRSIYEDASLKYKKMMSKFTSP